MARFECRTWCEVLRFHRMSVVGGLCTEQERLWSLAKSGRPPRRNSCVSRRVQRELVQLCRRASKSILVGMGLSAKGRGGMMRAFPESWVDDLSRSQSSETPSILHIWAKEGRLFGFNQTSPFGTTRQGSSVIAATSRL